jgi:GNAT superfamily N-acetyltransferase|tara:strand:+ start:676 stop:1143 length:468 start_codon:yes stop_codon:yes gene_type:complete
LAQLNIRPATENDEEMLLRESKVMIAESPRFREANFDDVKASKEVMTAVGYGGVFIAEEDGNFVGMLCGGIRDTWFGADLMGYDLFVYVAPSHRGGLALYFLVRRFEEWCWENGADTIDLGVITGIHPDKTIKAYGKLGYELQSFACTKANPRKE